MMVKQKVSQVLTSLQKKWHEFIRSKDGRDFIKSSGSNSRFILKQLLKINSLSFSFFAQKDYRTLIFSCLVVFSSHLNVDRCLPGASLAGLLQFDWNRLKVAFCRCGQLNVPCLTCWAVSPELLQLCIFSFGLEEVNSSSSLIGCCPRK